MSAVRTAVIDVGSNSTRLFLCDAIGPGGPDGERTTTITSLKRGANEDGSVTDEALARLDACCADYAKALKQFAPDEVIAVGTSAVRDAPNRDRVARIITTHLGTALRVLSGADEAQLAYAGARLAVKGSGPVVVMDIGGGSTELIRGDGDGPQAAVSLDIGAVRLTERHLHTDPPTSLEQLELREAVRDLATPALEGIGGVAPMVGVAGTMTTIASVALGVYDPERIHGLRLTRVEMEAIMADLASLPLAERKRVPGLQPERAESIVAGGLIACAVLDSGNVDAVAVSERDLLDGVILRLATITR